MRVDNSKSEFTLFTKEQFNTICGRDYYQAVDYVGVSSGDRDGIDRYPISSGYSGDTGEITVKMTDGNSEIVRINYLIVLGV